MDIGTILITLIVIAIFVTPFIWINIVRTQREKRLLLNLEEFATTKEGFITEHELGRFFAIGLDSVNNGVYFIQRRKEEEDRLTYLDLKEYKGCRVINTNKTTKQADGTFNTIEKLELAFSPLNKESSEIYLEFFNKDVNAQLTDELQSIEKWSTKINSLSRQIKR